MKHPEFIYMNHTSKSIASWINKQKANKRQRVYEPFTSQCRKWNYIRKIKLPGWWPGGRIPPWGTRLSTLLWFSIGVLAAFCFCFGRLSLHSFHNSQVTRIVRLAIAFFCTPWPLIIDAHHSCIVGGPGHWVGRMLVHPSQCEVMVHIRAEYLHVETICRAVSGWCWQRTHWPLLGHPRRCRWSEV